MNRLATSIRQTVEDREPSQLQTPSLSPSVIARSLSVFPISLAPSPRGRNAVGRGSSIHARRLLYKAPSPNDVWHLDEVVVTIDTDLYASILPSCATGQSAFGRKKLFMTNR
jgi:hypothetical protein